METKELEKLKSDIEEAKSKKSKAEGALEQIEKTWKEDFDCNSVEEVKQKIEETNKQIETLNEKLKVHTDEIEKVMGEEE